MNRTRILVIPAPLDPGFQPAVLYKYLNTAKTSGQTTPPYEHKPDWQKV